MFSFSLDLLGIFFIAKKQEGMGRRMLRFLFLSDYWKTVIYTIPAILISISAHEFAHGYVSYKLGDPTPKQEGRLTLNPFAHMDIAGTICMLVFRMGWAKPVGINPYYYKDRKKGIIAVSLAGPCMNYLLAFLSMILCGIFYKTNNDICVWFYYIAVLNVGLGTFNLIPISPLDGSKVLGELFPYIQNFYYRIRPYSTLMLIVLLTTGIIREPINWIENGLLNGMWKIVCNILNISVYGQSGIYL